MNKRELEKVIAAGTTVAVANGMNDYAKANAAEATVLATGQKRKVYSGERWDFAGHTAHDGVRVLFANTGKEEVVGARNIIATWADHVARRERIAAREAEDQNSRTNRQKRMEAAAAGIPGAYVKQIYLGNFRHDYTVALSLDAAEALAARLKEEA